jgi:UDP-N-acetylglucosamine 2-epimerase (non-hydrolysing)
MARVFFEELNLPTPNFNLDIGSKSHAEQTGLIMTGVEKILAEKNPKLC